MLRKMAYESHFLFRPQVPVITGKLATPKKSLKFLTFHADDLVRMGLLGCMWSMIMRTYEATIILLSISRGKDGVLRNAFSYAETLTVVHDLCGKSPENI